VRKKLPRFTEAASFFYVIIKPLLLSKENKEFPVSPDYVGLSVSTALTEKIIVETSKGKIEGARLDAH